MIEESLIEVAIPAELLAKIDRLAADWKSTRADVIVTSLVRFIADEDELGALELHDPVLEKLLQEGIDDIEAGRTFSQEEVLRGLEERMRRRAA